MKKSKNLLIVKCYSLVMIFIVEIVEIDKLVDFA